MQSRYIEKRPRGRPNLSLGLKGLVSLIRATYIPSVVRQAASSHPEPQLKVFAANRGKLESEYVKA